MKKSSPFYLAFIILAMACTQADNNKLSVAGLKQAVEILRDSAGVNHIYAQNEHDLFFAQGYCAAKDRLFPCLSAQIMFSAGMLLKEQPSRNSSHDFA